MDPIVALNPKFQAAIAKAFGDAHASVDPALRRSDRADYQANVAMSLRKAVGGTPRDVAAKIVENLDLTGVADKVEIAGAGFINVTLSSSWLSTLAREVAADARLGLSPSEKPETVVLDYSAPNLAKEMHVGHLRSTIIGDSLGRVLEALGHKVIRQNHVGDWGTNFGMLIEHLVDEGGASTHHSIGDLDAFYKGARKKFDGDTAFADRSRKRVVSLQAGDAETLSLWAHLVDSSKHYFLTAYQVLGVKLTSADYAGESLYNPMLPGVVKDLEDLGLGVVSEGALCVFPPGFTGHEGAPLPLIVRKQDGGYGYATSDLAAVRYRVDHLKATRLVYVVGAPQSTHLAMVYKSAELAGWLKPPARAEHVAFGSVLGPDKKMFKTRAGDTVRLIDLLDEAKERARTVVAEKNPDLDPVTQLDVARAVGIGAVKYADLSSDRIKDYVFDWSRMLAFEGNTAPYLQYAHARIRSILRKAAEQGAARNEIAIVAPAERALALAILGFGAAVREVELTLEPHKLCTYLYALASAFSTFYEQCPVLKADGELARGSRLALCDLTSKVLAAGLDLLGIEAPQQM
jgi:arginyl-tRNA synthetase